MQVKTPPPLPSVVKREDKMEAVRTFIMASLLLPRPACPDQSPDHSDEITVLARSAESPVARALASLGSEIARRGITIRAIFGHLECEKSPAGWSIAGPEIPFNRQLRWAKNPRLADAHEQLVLGPQTSWIGDCLRRDPSRRDAYEQFAATDAHIAATLQTSFARLWAASVPLQIRSPKAAQPVIADAIEAAALAALNASDDTSGPMIASSH